MSARRRSRGKDSRTPRGWRQTFRVTTPSQGVAREVVIVVVRNLPPVPDRDRPHVFPLRVHELADQDVIGAQDAGEVLDQRVEKGLPRDSGHALGNVPERLFPARPLVGVLGRPERAA